jgi:hypothetical protein
MALTRKLLTAMGIDGDKIDEIINAHSETVEALKAERDNARREAANNRADTEKLQEVQTELDELKNAQGNNVFETRYNELKTEKEALQQEFDQYKADIAAGEEKRAKESVYRDLLRSVNISDKRIDKIIKVSDIDSIELNKDGKLKDEESLKKSIEEEWGDFIVKQRQEGADTPTPPSNNTPVPRGESRAARIAAQYHANLYGEAKEDK